MEDPIKKFPLTDGYASSAFTPDKVKLEKLSKGKVVYSMIVGPEHCNMGNRCTSTLIDVMTTYALITLDRHPGVSTELNVSFLSAAPLGSKIYITSEVNKAGKTLAFMTCTITSEDNKIIALGRHTKHSPSL